MSIPVHFIDVTNRDGVQASRILLPKLAKTMINLYLDEMGVFQSEIGFPTLRHEVNYINANLELEKAGAFRRMRLGGWCRGIVEDIEMTFRNCPGIRHLNLSISTSDIMIAGKFRGKKRWTDILRSMTDAVALARRLGAETVGINAEDASRTDMARLVEFAAAGREAGADRIRYCDTIGTEDPLTIHDRIRELAATAGLPVEMHCHNDLGMAVAVSIAGAQGAIESGVDCFINTTINGYGERCGNCDLVSAMLALKFSRGLTGKMRCDDHTDLTKAWKTARYASHAFGLPEPINQPGVGANAFAHESGIHVDGALKDRRSYELYEPAEVGRGDPELVETGRIITTGEYGGIKGFRHVYGKLGIHFHDDREARRILDLVQYANMHLQKPLTDDELRLIARYPDIVCRILTVNPAG